MLGFDALIIDPQSSTFIDRDQDPASLITLLAWL
jgi:hypothetical protein